MDLDAAEDDERHHDDDGRARCPRWGMPGKFEVMTPVMELDCTAEPMPKDAMAANSANAPGAAASPTRAFCRSCVNARFQAYMAPPSILPSWSFTRYFTAAKRLGVLRGDAEHAGEPHPQHGARAAGQNGRAHAHDVARADGGRQGRASARRTGPRRPGASGSFVTDSLMAVGILRWMNPRAKRQEQMRSQQQHDHRRPPHEGVDVVDHLDNVHADILSLLGNAAWRRSLTRRRDRAWERTGAETEILALTTAMRPRPDAEQRILSERVLSHAKAIGL